MSEPTMIVMELRKRGRPRAAEPGSPVTTWMPVSLHDRLISVAGEREISISKLILEKLVIALEPQK